MENCEIGQNKRIIEGKKSISRNNFETVIVYDTQGNEIFRQEGESQSVKLTSKQLAQMQGAILVHNHPFNAEIEQYGLVNTSVFSSSDLNTAFECGLKELRMVVGNEAHSFSWRENVAPKQVRELISMLSTETEIANRAIQTAQDKADSDVENGIITNIHDYAAVVYGARVRAVDKVNSVLSDKNNQEAFGYDYRKGNLR